MTTISNALAARQIDVAGTSTNYHDAGEGAVVLLLHGSGPGVSAEANWRQAMPYLAQGARVVALDLVGWGATERPADVHYSLRTWTDHAWGLLDALGIDEPVSVIGNSLGGRIALQMAEDQPRRLDRIVLMGAPGVGMTFTDGLKALRAYEPSEENMRALLLGYFAVDPSIITDELVRIRHEASAAPGAQEAYHAMFHAPEHAGGQLAITEEQVLTVTHPVLLVHGREDKVVPVEVAWNMLALLPNADLHVFARCGHWTQIERADAFNRLVSDFLGVRTQL